MPTLLCKDVDGVQQTKTVDHFTAKHLENYLCKIKKKDHDPSHIYNLIFVKDDNTCDDRFISPNGELHLKWDDIITIEYNNGKDLLVFPLHNDKLYTVTLFNGLTHTLRYKNNIHPYRESLFVSDDGSIKLSMDELSFIQEVI